MTTEDGHEPSDRRGKHGSRSAGAPSLRTSLHPQPEESFSPHLLNTQPRPPRMRASGQRLGRGRAREP